MNLRLILLLSVVIAQSGVAQTFDLDEVTLQRTSYIFEATATSVRLHGEKAQIIAARLQKKYSNLPKFSGNKSELSSVGESDFVVSEIEKAITQLQQKDQSNEMVDLLEFAVAVNPKRVDLAYQRRLLEVKLGLLEDQVSLLADSKPGRGVYEISLAEIGGGSTQGGNGLAKAQALIKGLLVSQVTGSRFAGSASQMNATVVSKIGDENPMQVKFNQKVGSSMNEAVDNMMKYLNQRHESIPKGVQVEFAFEEQYVPKDGPSAGVACTLMIESLIKGYDYNPNFAVTGALDPKGKVGGVGGVTGKIRGAIARNCEIVAIPSENESVISDMVITDGVASLVKIQVIEIEDFDQALKVARRSDQLEAETRTALAEYKKVMALLNQRGGMGYLNNPKVKVKLQEVVRVMPNHLSAKYLLLKSVNRNPKTLTLLGSVRAIDEEAHQVIEELQSGNFKIQDSLAKDQFGATMSALNRLRPILDDRTRPCADAIIEFTSNVRTAIQSPPQSNGARIKLSRDIKITGSVVGREYDKLFDREDVKKELLIE